MLSISPDIIILGFIAGFILYRLFTILGKHDEDGKILHEKNMSGSIIDITSTAKVEDISVNLDEENKLAPSFVNVMEQIRADYPSFSLKKFITGAKKAFEIILNAFASNDREMLGNLLDEATFKKFTSEIDKRIKSNRSLNITLVAIDDLVVKDISYKKHVVTIKIFILSQQINLTKDIDGNIIEGDPSQIDMVEDVWTFSKKFDSGKEWKLINVNNA